MTFKLASLRISPELDASGFVRGAAQMTQAQREAAAASVAVGRALSEQDAALGKTSTQAAKLSKSYVDGYAAGSRFEAELRKISLALSSADKSGVDAARAVQLLEGVYRNFGQTASQATMQVSSLGNIAPILRDLNQQFDAMAAKAATAGKAQRDFAQFVKERQALDATRSSLKQQLRPDQVELEQHEANKKNIALLKLDNSYLEREELRHAQAMRSILGMNIMGAKGTSGLARYEVINLGRQVQDVFVSLQAGQSPMTVLIQQGTQIADVFAASSASMSGVAKQAIGWLGRFAVSTAGITTGLVAMGAAGAYAGYQFADGQREVERSLNGVGRASGVTIGQINAIAEASARSSRLSVSAAREAAAAYAGTGNIGPSILPGLTTLTKGYSVLTGQDIAKAQEELAAAFADPIKGAETLNAKLGFLDARTREHIRTMLDQNNTAGAQKVLLDAVTNSVGNAADRVSWLARAWDAVRNASSNAFDSLGRTVGGQTSAADRLSELMDRGDRYRPGFRASSRTMTSGQDAINRTLAEIATAQIKAEQATKEAQAARLSLTVLGIANAAEPEIEALKKIKAELSAIEKLLSTVEGRNAFGDDARAARLIERKNNAIGTFLTPEQRLAQTGDVTVQSIMARTLAERLSVALATERLAIAGKELTAEEQRLTVANKLREVQAQANREAQDALRTSQDNLSLAGLSPYQRMLRQTQIDERNNRERFGGATGVPATSVPSVGPVTGLDQGFAEKVKALIEAVGDSGATLTSGFRSREKQQQLYDRYGPFGAAAPGNSQHERGTAADYTFSSPEARARAMALAQAYGIRALSSNGGAVHFDQGAGAGGARAGGADAATRIANDTKSAYVQNEYANAVRSANDNLREQNSALDLLERQAGLTAFQIGQIKKEQELTNQFTAAGIPITSDMAKGIRDVANEYGRLAERQASVRLTQDALFERSQLGRTPGEQAIAARLRGQGIGEDSPLADMLRMNQLMTDTRDVSNDALKGFLGDLRQGKSMMEALNNVANKLIDKLLNASVDMLTAGLFGGRGGSGGGGGIFGGFLQSAFGMFGFGGGRSTGTGGLWANGGAFGNGGVHAFANGGAFTNSVVTKPTLFPFANGIGLMGERGDEAIMPLKRNGRGQLGVHVASGGSNDNRSPVVQMSVKVINNGGDKVRTERGKDEAGNDELRVIVDQMVSESIGEGRQAKALQSRHGISQVGVRR